MRDPDVVILLVMSGLLFDMFDSNASFYFGKLREKKLRKLLELVFKLWNEY